MSEAMRHAVAADVVFDGESTLRHAAVVIEGARIVEVCPADDMPSSIAVRRMPSGAWIAPGFIDVQVNGGGDVLFNASPDAGAVCAIAAAHRKFGTTGLLPTLITDAPEKMRNAIEAVEVAMEREPGVLGIHLEGPFLSPGKPGVHDPRFIRVPAPEDLALLTAPRKGRTLVTLAPEQVPAGFVGALAAAGIRIALGHSLATYEQTRAAMAEGLTGFTHLFNAMRPVESREPGPIAAALESANAWFGIIVDGIHVAPAALRLCLGRPGVPMLVTDAMPPVGGRRATFRLYGEEITARDGRCVRRDGTLAGAFLDMATAVRNCVRLLGTPLEHALRFASTNPALFLGLGNQLGLLKAGYRADMVAFHPADVSIVETWVAGRSS